MHGPINIRCTNSSFIISLLYASACFEQYVLIIRRSKLYYIASGIITPVGSRPVHRLRESSLNLCLGQPITLDFFSSTPHFPFPCPFWGVVGHLVTEKKIGIIIDSEVELWENFLALNTWNGRIKVVIPNNNIEILNFLKYLLPDVLFNAFVLCFVVMEEVKF